MLAYEVKLSSNAARTVVELACIARDEGQWPDGLDALLRAIAALHPQLVSEFDYFPWPHLNQR